VGKQKVLTMSTLLAADWVAKPADCLGFRMFLRVPSHCKGWNAVRVPPRAQCFRRSAAFMCLFVCTLCTLSPLI
jgi:hypothetical protein